MEKTYKYRLYPNYSQEKQILETFKASVFVYNYFLEKSMDFYNQEKKLMNFYEMSRALTTLKNEQIWLKVADKWALQNSVKNLYKAYQRYFKERKNPNYVKYSDKQLRRSTETGKELTLYDCAWHPKFKSIKKHRQSYTTQNTFGSSQTQPAIDVKDRKIKLPKLGWVKIKGGYEVQGRILHATVELTPSGLYFVYIGCTEVDAECFPKTNKQIGIDLGIKNYITYSDGRKESSMQFLKTDLEKIDKLHRELDRKSGDGANRERVRIKLAKAYEHLNNRKIDYLQKLSTDIVKEFDVICIEGLKIQKLKDEAIGSNKEKHSLRKELNLCGFSSFIRMLEYKAKWYGKELYVVDTYFPSSQLCHVCGYRNSLLKDRNVREWDCPECGTHHDRDINAAINILNEGLKQKIN